MDTCLWLLDRGMSDELISLIVARMGALNQEIGDDKPHNDLPPLPPKVEGAEGCRRFDSESRSADQRNCFAGSEAIV